MTYAGHAKDSVLHGFCQHFGPDKLLTFVGMMRNGIPFGTCWKLITGIVYLHCKENIT